MEEPLTISQLDRTAIEWIEQEAQCTGLPIEAVARRLIYRGLEVERQQARQQRHYDLDALAGTWSAEEADEFRQAIAEVYYNQAATKQPNACTKRGHRMTAPNQELVVPFDIPTLIEICRRNDVTMVGLVGSMARGEATDSSDIDLIVRFAKPKSLISLITLEQELTAALGREVDLLTEAALSPYLRERILHDLRVLYAT